MSSTDDIKLLGGFFDKIETYSYKLEGTEEPNSAIRILSIFPFLLFVLYLVIDTIFLKIRRK
jgi:hypothetical protein